MNTERFLRIQDEVYLRTINGVWKKFDKVMADILEGYIIKIKKRKFRIDRASAWGGRRLGKNDNEIWIFSKLTQKEKEKTLIYEAVYLHYEDNEVIKRKNKKDDVLMEEVAEKIWKNEKSQGIVEMILDSL